MLEIQNDTNIRTFVKYYEISTRSSSSSTFQSLVDTSETSLNYNNYTMFSFPIQFGISKHLLLHLQNLQCSMVPPSAHPSCGSSPLHWDSPANTNLPAISFRLDLLEVVMAIDRSNMTGKGYMRRSLVRDVEIEDVIPILGILDIPRSHNAKHAPIVICCKLHKQM